MVDDRTLRGHYNFTWLDPAISLAARHNIAVVMGTPTDATPAWLTLRCPQTLRVDEAGHRAEHSNRRQFNYANPLIVDCCCQTPSMSISRRAFTRSTLAFAAAATPLARTANDPIAPYRTPSNAQR